MKKNSRQSASKEVFEMTLAEMIKEEQLKAVANRAIVIEEIVLELKNKFNRDKIFKLIKEHIAKGEHSMKFEVEYWPGVSGCSDLYLSAGYCRLDFKIEFGKTRGTETYRGVVIHNIKDELVNKAMDAFIEWLRAEGLTALPYGGLEEKVATRRWVIVQW